MKSIMKIITSMFIILSMWNCDSEMMEYEGKSGVYFMMQRRPVSGYGDPEVFEYVDTTRVSFASIVGNDTVLPVRIRVMGEVRDYDRFVSLRLVEDETTAKVGEDYEGIELNPCIKRMSGKWRFHAGLSGQTNWLLKIWWSVWCYNCRKMPTFRCLWFGGNLLEICMVILRIP